MHGHQSAKIKYLTICMSTSQTQEDKEKTGDVVKQTSSTSSEPSSTGGVASEKTTPTQPQGDDSSEDKLQQVAKGEGQVGGASSEEINKLKVSI